MGKQITGYLPPVTNPDIKKAIPLSFHRRIRREKNGTACSIRNYVIDILTPGSSFHTVSSARISSIISCILSTLILSQKQKEILSSCSIA